MMESGLGSLLEHVFCLFSKFSDKEPCREPLGDALSEIDRINIETIVEMSRMRYLSWYSVTC